MVKKINSSITRTTPKTEHVKSRLFVNSIEKGMRVLGIFNSSRRQLSLVQIADLTGLDLSSVQRCVHTLFSLGYLIKDKNSRKYELSVKMLDFTFKYLSSSELVKRATPYLQQLSQETEETANLTVRDGTEIVFILRLVSRHVLTGSVTVGSRLPAYCTAPGLAMLAYLPEIKVEAILKSSNLIKHTLNTINDPRQIRERLKIIKQKGYANTQEEYLQGDISTAAAIRDANGYSIGAINVGVSKARWGGIKDEQRISSLVISAASAISIHKA